MLRFEGDRDFPLPPTDLWAKLTDARFLVSCLPDVEKVEQADADRAVLVLRPSLAFVRGALDVTLGVADKNPPASARVRAQGKGIGSTSAVEATLGFAPQGGGTRVHWAAAVTELGGLLKLVPQGLIRGAAQKVIDDAWASVEARLRQGTA
jgi:carbon monoxide dehydrogenase subunit G